ncbi:MAG: efflux transporter, family, subunit [Gemmatimonadetes bacterium]|jgi:RND family efflux transporter MFP subunit|nr:efflux transporter, family, subunit [Gemmatimonadota bacterium]
MTAMTGTRARRTTALVATACLALAGGCKKADPASADSTAAPVVAAKTVAATAEPFTHTVSAIGTVVARPGRFAALSAPVATRISRVYVAAGQRVAEGQPLVEFEQVGFNAAASGAQAALTAAERNYERATRLANEGIVPRKDAEQAAADLGRARTDAVTARRAQQLSVLRSPVSGVVTRMAAVLGAAADPAQVLVEVADPSAFDVVLSLGPSEAGAVHQGARVTLSAGEKTGGESIGTGLVASVGASLDTASRSVAIRVTTTSTRRPLRMGESVFGEIATQVIPNAVVVPVEALVPGDEVGTYRLFVVDRTGTAMGRDVKVGGRTETKAEIVEGLKAGEMVVTQGAFAVQDSAKVARPTPAAP